MNKKKITAVIILILLMIGLCAYIYYDKLIDKGTNIKNTNTTSTKNIDSSTSIIKGGTYNFSGNTDPVTIDTDEDVTITLSGVSIKNDNGPAIYVKNANKVTIIVEGENTLTSKVNENEDACIYSKDDLELGGTGTLTVNSNIDGISSSDDLIIKSGTYIINTDDDAIKGKDSVTIEGGKFTINAMGDGIKATNEEDIKKGIITINDGEFNITTTKDGFDSTNIIKINKGTYTIKSSDDGIHADGYLEINNGSISIDAVEGLEATYVKINDGTISIDATDDGINAGNKSNNYSILIEINGGNLTINMGQGDTDGIDSNGNIIINGGTININGNSAFDYDGTATYNGGKLIINGEETTEINNQFMGGPQGGGRDEGPQNNQEFR